MARSRFFAYCFEFYAIRLLSTPILVIFFNLMVVEEEDEADEHDDGDDNDDD